MDTGIKFPRQHPFYVNSRDVLVDGEWIEECVVCGCEAGDCEHTVEDNDGDR